MSERFDLMVIGGGPSRGIWPQSALRAAACA